MRALTLTARILEAPDPERVAVVCGDVALTYRTLLGLAADVALRLSAAGVAGEEPVAVLASRRPEFVIGALGTMLAGACFVPVDPDLSPARRDQLLAISRASKIVGPADSAVANILIDLTAPVSGCGCVDEATPNSLAYQLFTSGSTGVPKLVMIEHRSVCALLDGFERVAAAHGPVISTAVCPFSFDVSIWELFVALTNGGTVHILDGEAARQPNRLVGYIAKHGVNTAYVPPLALDMFVEESRSSSPLRRMLVGVEAIAQGTLQKLREKIPHLQIINGYGPTEVTICSTFFPFRQAQEPERPVPIGWAVEGWTLAVVDDELVPVTPGEIGELLIGGIGLARGYAHDSDMTERSFVNTALLGRCYRSGDYVRELPDGALEYAGRRDDQIKIRGFRVEPAEIEIALRQQPGVVRALVLAPKGRDGRRLYAYVEGKTATETLRKQIGELLAGHMVPSRLVVVPEFPVTENGKIDRSRLTEAARRRPEIGELVVPAAPIECQMAAIWCEALDLDSVGVHDNFFDLGGDSMLALAVARRSAMLVNKPGLAPKLLSCITIAKAAEALTGADEYPEVSIDEEEADCPATFGQQGLWALQHLDIANPALVLPFVIRFKGDIALEAIADAIRQLLRHHDTFSLAVRLVEGRIRLCQAEPPIINVEKQVIAEVDLRAFLAGLATKSANSLIRLREVPIEIHLLSTSGNDGVALFMFHHIAVDGSSLPLIVSELVRALEGRPLEGGERAVRSFARWQQACFERSIWNSHKAYWDSQLGSLPDALTLPIDRPRPSRRSGRGMQVEQVLSARSTATVHRLARANSTTPFRVLLGLIGLLAHRLSGQGDVIVATPVSSRHQPSALDAAIGYFVNFLPIRFEFNEALTFSLLMQQVQEKVTAAQVHADFPIELMIRGLETDVAQSLTRLVVAQKLFTGLPQRAGAIELQEIELPRRAAIYELAIFVAETARDITLAWEFDSDLFDSSSIERFQGILDVLLNSAEESPSCPVGRLDLMMPAERAELLDSIDFSIHGTAAHGNLIGLFDEQASANPVAIAVTDSGGSLTYGELAASSLSVAAELRRQGVGRETPVLVFTNRSTAFLIGILGILRAGGYYIPIDAAMPGERVQFIVSTVEARHAIIMPGVDERCPAGVRGLEIGPLLQSQSGASIEVAREPDSLAYVMFTSGSTGTPKGVAVPDRAIVRLVRDQNFISLGTSDVFALISNLSFDAATLEIWGALLNGGRISIPSEALISDPEKLLRFIADSGVTAGFFNATAFRWMIHLDAAALRGLHSIIVGGENVPEVLFVRAARALDYRSLVNGYGPTENTTFSCCHRMTSPPHLGQPIPIGRAIANSAAIVVDENMSPVPVGVVGEIIVSGAGLARGYIGNPEETQRRFIKPFGAQTWYRTGDLGRKLANGDIVCMGRRDHQIKIRGFRIEIGEIEVAIMRCPGVEGVVVLAPATPDGPRLEAYVEAQISAADIRKHLAGKLPSYMLPADIFIVDKLPVTSSGKLDRMVLRAAAGAVPVSTMRETPSARHLRDRLTSIFSDVLKHRQFGPQDRFFEIGGNSLLLIILAGKLTQSFEHEITPIDVLDNPTLDGLARLLQSRLGVVLDASDGQRPTNEKITDNRIAVIGRAGRFPNAACVDDFWRRTSEGVIDIRTLDEQPEGLLPYRGVLDGVDRFDSGFFGVPEGEARLLDPQQRFILEVTQEALDDAAFDPRQSNAVVSVYAACGPAREIEESGSLSAQYERTLATAPDFTATRISYRFDLRGESVTVQTGCSSSLVAVHMACESLLSRKSDVALAGGVSIAANQQLGYAVEDGMITSPTGRCCPFDVRANGTVPGSAVGMVAMMRLADAVDQGAPIQAVILGSAINNDGASKVGFMAPSPSGQAAVITAALGRSNIGGDSLGYIETHGTGTRLGDQAEIEGLGRAIRPLDGHDIALGSVKANYGHLDRAAGIVGLLRAIEAVKHGVIPPLAGFEQPDEDLALAARGFYVPTRATGWPEQNHPRRAGVSSFGVGGTNAHVIVEQAPELPTARPVLTPVPIVISAASPGSLKTTRLRLAQHIETGPPGNLNGLARSLFEGRRHQKFRQAFVATDPGELCRQLQFEAPNHVEAAVSPSLVWLFPGQGDATVDGFKALYDNQRVYRAALDECANLVRQYSDIDVINLLFGAQPDASRFEDMGCFQPVMFAVQYALSDFCESLGVQPGALIGHSLGEVVAATRAGVFKLEDAVAFVIKRGQLMQLTRPGAMISVTLPPSRMARYLLPGTSIAAYNGRELVAISGLSEPVAELEAKLIADGISVRPLAIPRAAHCSQMQETARELGRFVSTLQLTPPRIPIVSNVTGGWADVGMATADYWARHIEMPVRFVESLNCVAETGRVLGLIVGPGNTMRRLVAHEMEERAVDVVELSTDAPHALDTLNSLWCAGANVNVWAATENPATAKVSLPPTVFDHRFSWPFREVANKAPTSLQVSRQDDSGAWLWQTKTTAVKSSSRQTREVRCRLLNHPDGMVESLIRSLSGLRPVENLSEATDVIWWIDHLDPSALQVQLRAIAERAEQELRVWIIAGRSEPLCLDRPTDRAIGLGIVRAGALEHPKSSWHVVDVAGSSDMASDIAAAIDLADPPTTLKAGLDGLAAVRPEHAWPDWRSRPLRDDGCYIITGGAGRVASALVKAIRREVAAPIVLLGRQPFESVQPRLTSLANNVVYRQLDVTDAAGTAELFTELRSEYARINGVIHAAGETDTRRFATLATLEASSWAEISAAKLRGTSAIAAALRPDEADFVLLCSSLSTAIGGVGFASYIAANATLDEYAESRWERGDKRWISVGWEAWTEGDARTDIGPARYALDDEDGYHAFMRCLCVRGPVVLISTAPIDARIDEIREQVGRTSVPSSQILGAVAASPSPAVAVENVLRAVLGRIPDDPERDLREEAIESLTILQIVTRLRKSLKIELSLMDVMRNLSVNGLRHLVETAIGSVPRDGEFEIVRVPEAASYPTSSAQRRWLILMPEKYGGLDIVVHVAGNVTLGALTAAVRSTIERHSGLRTTFTFRGGKWLQHIVSTICVEEVDLRQEVYWKSTLRAIAKEKSERWYEAEAISPPFEIVVAALPDGQFALVIHGHHVIFDGWSSSIFLKEIADAVAGRGSRQPFQYVDYATAQQNYLAGPAILPVRKYWQRHFADAPVPTRVRGFADVETAEDNGDVLPFLLDQKVVELLAHRALGLHATTFMLFAAAYGLVLSRLTGSFDLIFGTTAAARPTPQSEEIIGVFVNPLPLRLKFSADQSLESYLETVKQVLTGFHENQNYPLEDLLKHVPSFRNCDLNSTFHCYLLYQNYWRAPEDVLRFRRLNLEASGHHKLMREFEIVLEDEDGSVHGELWYRASRFTPQQACLWRDMFVSCVADISTADLQVTVAKLLQKFVIDT